MALRTPTEPFMSRIFTDNPANETLQIGKPTISQDSLGAVHFAGEVVNKGNEPARFVEIITTFYDLQNRVIGTKNAFTNPQTILPGQAAPFDLAAGYGDNIQIANIAHVKIHLDWRDSLQLTKKHPLGAKAKSQNCNTHCIFESGFAKQIGVTKDKNEKWAFMEIDSDTSWSGSVLDTTMKSETKAGSGEGTIPFECSSFGTYSLTMQKQTEDGSLRIKVVRNGNLLKDGSTTAPYGLVSIVGDC